MSVGIALANDSRAREGLYVAMSCGAQRNEVYAYRSAQEPTASVIGQPPGDGHRYREQRLLLACPVAPDLADVCLGGVC